MFNNLYNMGADATLINKEDRNIMLSLAKKKIFNVDLYKKLIDDGVDPNKKDKWHNSIFINSLFNQKILELIIDKIDLNNVSEDSIINNLLYVFKYYPNKRKMIINKIKYLISKGIKFTNYKLMAEELNWSISNKIDIVNEFIVPLSKYFDINFINTFIEHKLNDVDFLSELMDKYPNTYVKIKEWYGKENFNRNFKDFLDSHPYIEDSHKYNL
jgi:hypothetical protein